MSDHFSGPAVIGDPSVDITDFYAFPSPERPGNLVLIMDVFPMATPQSFFSDVVTYRFRLRPLTRSGGSITHGTAEHTIDVMAHAVEAGNFVCAYPEPTVKQVLRALALQKAFQQVLDTPGAAGACAPHS